VREICLELPLRWRREFFAHLLIERRKATCALDALLDELQRIDNSTRLRV
jgi:hypothetical protein